MKNFKNDLWQALRQRTFLITLLFCLLGGILFSVYVNLNHVGDLQVIANDNMNTAKRLLNQYADYEGKPGGEGKNFQLLLNFRTLVGQQQSNLVMDQYDRYNEVELKRLENQRDLLHSSLPEKQFLAQEWQLQSEQAQYQALVKEDKNPPITQKSGAFVTALLAGALLSWGFLLFGFYLSDNLLDFLNHATLVRAYPVTFLKQVRSRTLVRLVTSLMLMLALLIGAGLSMLVLDGIGDWFYPLPIYLLDGFVTVPLWGYLLIVFAYSAALILFLNLLTFCLNTFVKNRYVTFFVLALLFSTTLLISKANHLALPLLALNPQNLASGELAVTTGLPYLSVTTGILYLLGLSLIAYLVMQVAAKRDWIYGGAR